MDAHTLNAWTRFALQKGGIGTCTALIDNPATEPEDLMFMTGEKIVVLRRLEEEGSDTNGRPTSVGAKRKSGNAGGPQDADAWFLGYCEGVVGRFKGGHVQFHGRLKKPVLMRRSGAGNVRESSTRPMSKSEAASLHASQVPPGIPITAVNSDGEEDLSETGHRYAATQASERSTHGSDVSHADAKSLMAESSRMGFERNHAQSLRSQTHNQSSRPMNGRGAGFGVTTPPLSDDGHRKEVAAFRPRYDDEDSDDSSSMLPWARHSRESSAASQHSGANGRGLPRARGPPQDHLRMGALGSKGSTPNPRIVHGLTSSYLPPSPISSNESPMGRASHEQKHPLAQGDSSVLGGRAPSVESLASSNYTTSTASDSEDEPGSRRRDYAFSIYDVYGRDSVAFPNFSYKETFSKAQRQSRLAFSKSSESLAAQAGNEPMPPSPNPISDHARQRGNLGPGPDSGNDPTTPRENKHTQLPVPSQYGHGHPDIPSALRSPSGRRPNAAPDPRGPVPGAVASSQPAGKGPSNIASSLRRKVEGSTPPTTSSPVFSSNSGFSNLAGSPPSGTGLRPGQPQHGPGSFDPRRRPSAGSVLPPGAARQGSMTNPSMPGQGQMMGGLNARGPPPLEVGQPSQPHAPGPQTPGADSHGPPGFAVDTMRRPGFAEARENKNRRSGSLTNITLDLEALHAVDRNQASATPSPRGAMASPRRSPYGQTTERSPNLGPVRATSDRSSVRERVGSGSGSGLLRKNPSNPTPGLHGGSMGMTGLSPNPHSRSGSPMSQLSAPPAPGMGFDGVRRVSGASSVGSPRRSPLSNGPISPTGDGGPISYDSLGFIVRPGQPQPLVTMHEDPETKEKWTQILAEDDVVSAKKSRKVKKLVRSGIPSSMRGQVWLFLAGASVRRRAGLFEQLCKTSSGPKGKKGKEAIYETIEKDLDRSFPDHQLFRGERSTGKADLEAILKAYVHYNPVVGYTQGMGMLVGLMLIQMPAEDAFWLLCALLRDVHMEGYYTQTMKQLHVDGVVFGNLLSTMDPELYNKLDSHGVQPIMFTPNWFLPLFTRVLPWDTLLRVWDIFFFEGPSWILRVALAIIRIVREPLMNPRTCPGQGEAMQLLLHPPQANLIPDNVLSCAFSVKLKDGDVRKLTRNASKLVREKNMLGDPNVRGRDAQRSAPDGSRSRSAPPKRI
ncbi:TBC-domain-containing protein [Violaceomyces palustris]|uniref:TBC-domain-containing protein n=1 Tax=Violaceomyces palustris TaxID=1673888 RepID=A0ACD0NXM1_9BASI|nr:TBC-domain-containing protein [Violaceomyces palustris]